MKVGKLDWNELKQLIENNRSVNREDVRVKSGIGEDCSVISFGSLECVVSTDPITGADKNIGRLAVHINCNDIAASGAEPVGLLVTILAPETATLEEISEIMREIDEETKKLNVEILGGHTEVTRAVNKIVVSCTAIGKIKAMKAVTTAGAKIGDDIIVTKSLCLEGSSILANDYSQRASQVLTPEELLEAINYIDKLSVVEEGIAAGKIGANSMHDITEGGVLGALWEMAKASNMGFLVYEEKMPISEITRRLCKHFKIDPLKFISSGSMLITAENGQEFVHLLQRCGIKSTIIGKITEGKGILVDANKVENEVCPPERDELFLI
ncbi:MAG: AIR synthase [Clostridiaceae bacterium]|nr:AIR synthase [Clostridiaceae bacterium]